MKGPALLGAGIAAVAICCIAPALVLLLGTIGLSAWLAWLDFAWLPLWRCFSASQAGR